MTLDQLLVQHQHELRANTKIKAGHRLIIDSTICMFNKTAFLTPAQVSRVVSILKLNQESLALINPLFVQQIQTPVWAFEVKHKDTKRKLSFVEDEQFLELSMSYHDPLRQEILSGQAWSHIRTNIKIKQNSYSLYFKATESAIYNVVQKLKQLRIVIDPDIIEYYREIKKYVKEGEEFLNIKNASPESTLVKTLSEEIDITDPILLLDRRIKFQYRFNCPDKLIPTTLTEKIANRNNPYVNVRPHRFTLSEVYQAVCNLKRKQILFVFPTLPEECLALLKLIVELNVKQTGIYFRFPSQPGAASEFNNFVKEHQMNQRFEPNVTEIIGIQYNTIPKFLIENQWKPDAVITFSPYIKHGKISVWVSHVDLLVYYLNCPPMGVCVETM